MVCGSVKLKIAAAFKQGLWLGRLYAALLRSYVYPFFPFSFSTNLFVFNLFTLTPCRLRDGGSGMDNEVYITLALIPRANENPTCQTVPVVT